MQKIMFWIKNARLHTLPMTFMSCLVVFIWALTNGGNALYGIIAFVGVLFAHMGVNLIDDYFDYKREARTVSGFEKMQKDKCKYLLEGKATLKELAIAFITCFLLAALIGLGLTIICGWQVALIAFLAGVLCLSYPQLTYIGLGEFAVGMTFGPLLYAGIYFVMTGQFSTDVIWLSIPMGLFIVGVLHVHALMDYDGDIKDRKVTLCTVLKSKHFSLYALGLMMFIAYSTLVTCVLKGIFPKTTLITLLTFPLAIKLYQLMKLHIENSEMIPEKKFWMEPMENWAEVKENGAERFMIRFYMARNIVTFFSLLMSIGILIG